jgi:hypothetical protein
VRAPTIRLSVAEWLEADRAAHGHKYHARPCRVAGAYFDSTGEARRYAELELEARAGLIRDLARQVRIPLHATKTPGPEDPVIAVYVADFAYTRGDRRILEDWKGHDTALSRHKRRHVRAQYGIEVLITGAAARPRRRKATR